MIKIERRGRGSVAWATPLNGDDATWLETELNEHLAVDLESNATTVVEYDELGKELHYDAYKITEQEALEIARSTLVDERDLTVVNRKGW